MEEVKVIEAQQDWLEDYGRLTQQKKKNWISRCKRWNKIEFAANLGVWGKVQYMQKPKDDDVEIAYVYTICKANGEKGEVPATIWRSNPSARASL